MGSAFDTFAEKASTVVDAVFGVSVQYKRGSVTLTFVAVPSDPASRYSDAISAQLFAGFKAWDFDAANLGALARPGNGDTLVDAAGNTWTVLPPEGVPVYAFVDPEERRIRVYTKQTGRGA